jgi:hypothetical protein
LASLVILRLSTRSGPPRVTRRNRFSPGIVEIDPTAQLRPFRDAERVGASDHRGELADHDLE